MEIYAFGTPSSVPSIPLASSNSLITGNGRCPSGRNALLVLLSTPFLMRASWLNVRGMLTQKRRVKL